MNNKKICALLLAISISSQVNATGSSQKPPMAQLSMWQQIVEIFTL
jgi:hypothetical protein